MESHGIRQMPCVPAKKTGSAPNGQTLIYQRAAYTNWHAGSLWGRTGWRMTKISMVTNWYIRFLISKLKPPYFLWLAEKSLRKWNNCRKFLLKVLKFLSKHLAKNNLFTNEICWIFFVMLRIICRTCCFCYAYTIFPKFYFFSRKSNIGNVTLNFHWALKI